MIGPPHETTDQHQISILYSNLISYPESFHRFVLTQKLFPNIPGSSFCVPKFVPKFTQKTYQKEEILHTWKIQVYTNFCLQNKNTGIISSLLMTARPSFLSNQDVCQVLHKPICPHTRVYISTYIHIINMQRLAIEHACFKQLYILYKSV